jgi:uncharacterized protein YfkK (UPF0435 family)
MPTIKKDKFSDLLLRNKNMRLDVKDMKAHQEIINDGTFKKDIRKEEKKKELRQIEDIFDKGKKKLNFSKNKNRRKKYGTRNN